VDVPEYGVRGKRGDFAPLISEELFYRVQAILSVACRARHRASERIPTFRCVASFAVVGRTRPHRQLVEVQRSDGSKCRFANARPEPDFR
jgi:hypothetical protein